MSAIQIVGEPDAALLETMTLVGCLVHGPTRTLLRCSTVSAADCGWPAFENPSPSPVAEAYCQGPTITLAGMRVALRLTV